MFRWNKLGHIFGPQMASGRDWFQEFAQAPATLEFPGFIRVYFSTRPKADPLGQYVSHSAYVDLDKIDLSKVRAVSSEPIMELGSTGDFDQFGIYPVSVIRVGDEVRAYYAGWTRCDSVPFNVAIGVASSSDGGQHFTKLFRGPVLSYSLDEPFVISGPKIRKYGDTWYLWYIAGRKWKLVDSRPEPVYKIRMATSSDGVQWVRENRDLIESKVEVDEAQASPDVFYANGKYHMFFCYRYSEFYRGRDHGYRIGYAHSTDLLHWDRDDSRAGIDVSEAGWDSEMISYPHVFSVGKRTYMLYLGNRVGRDGFGLAELEGILD